MSGYLTCEKTGKIRHPRERAEKAAASHRRRFMSSMQAYRCEECDSWHLGHARIRKPKHVRR